jgi:hypothetical protein
LSSATLDPNTEDANGNPDSGSIAVSNADAAPSSEAAASQCLAAVGSQTYDFGGKLRILAASGDYARIAVFWYSSSDCTAGLLDSSGTLTTTEVSGRWRVLYATDQAAPGNAASAQLLLIVFKSAAAGSRTMEFDDVVYGLAHSFPLGLFNDGFEQGETCTWSNFPCSP